MAIKEKASPVLPTVQQLEAELKREKYRGRYWKMLRGTVAVLVVVAATAVLISNLLLPILRIYGSSMTPTLVNGNIVAAVRNGTYQRGDIIAFYYNNKILVKRVIGMPGEWVDMDESGNVTIDRRTPGGALSDGKGPGGVRHRAALPGAGGRYFVMGDHRSVSSDSRSSQVGCVSEEQIVGKLLFRLWPLDEIGPIE